MPPIIRKPVNRPHPAGPDRDAAPTRQNQEHNLPRPNHPRPVIADQDNDLTCEICCFRMLSRQCKIRCPNCGFTRDCSDP